MAARAQKPYWVDDQLYRHEAYFYGESDADSRTMTVNVQRLPVDVDRAFYTP